MNKISTKIIGFKKYDPYKRPLIFNVTMKGESLKSISYSNHHMTVWNYEEGQIMVCSCPVSSLNWYRWIFNFSTRSFRYQPSEVSKQFEYFIEK